MYLEVGERVCGGSVFDCSSYSPVGSPHNPRPYKYMINKTNIEKELINIKSLPIEEQIKEINEIRKLVHKYSPMNENPIDLVLWVKNEIVFANDYNPNSVAPPEMKLLEHSIREDGYTQPIVTWNTEDKYQVVDGFHRNRIGKETEDIKNNIYNHLPITIIRENKTDKGSRISSTIRHNRARGTHSIDGMAQIVLDLTKRNWSKEKISKELGMDSDEVLRLSQITGLAEMFSDREFSEAWELEKIDEQDIEIDEDNLDI